MDYLTHLIAFIAGAGLMAVVIFATDAWYARRHPILAVRK